MQLPGKHNTGQCEKCQERETEHVLLKCSRYRATRKILKLRNRSNGAQE